MTTTRHNNDDVRALAHVVTRAYERMIDVDAFIIDEHDDDARNVAREYVATHRVLS